MSASASKMNAFLHRMLGRNSDEGDNDDGTLNGTIRQAENSPQQNKFNWMKKLGAYSPDKCDVSPSIRSPSKPITTKSSGDRSDYRSRNAQKPLLAFEDSRTNVEMANLEKIIHEFEEGFLSPTKHEAQKTMKSGRFVKQIVAAFEEKYKASDDHKTEADKILYEVDEDDETMQNYETNTETEMEDSKVFMGKTYVIDTPENLAFNREDSSETESVTYSRRSVGSEDLGTCTFAMDEDLTVSTPEKKLHDSTLRRSTNSKPIGSVETISGESPKSTALVRSNSSMRRERQPKIVGAFLKKPIEVEDTSIDWIPITGKKLPRKRSFKRLLAMLTGKKSSNKSSKLYGSQINLNEENVRELHDSGYDEKSCSSSSLASLVSITDMLLETDNRDIVTDRRILTTFRQSNSNDVGEKRESPNPSTESQSLGEQIYESTADDASETSSVSSKKLLLEEIPRSDVRLSLGPYFPSREGSIGKSSDFTDHVDSTISDDDFDFDFDDFSDDDTLTLAPPLPKHPFVSEKREKSNDEQTDLEPMKNFTFNFSDDVELRKKVESWKCGSVEVAYDTPRRYLSRSEPGLPTIGKSAGEIVYDVPKPEIRPRPRSSVYEDALSLKRRNANFSFSPPASGFYAFPSQQQPHYATVKPRNTRVCPSRELMRTASEIGPIEAYINYADSIGMQSTAL